MKKILIVSFLLFAYNSNAQKITWLSLEDAFKLNSQKPKKIIIDVYTDWCGWCKVMDKQTFTNPAVIKYINDNYYAVKLDAESRKDIKIGTTVYKFDANSKSHQAAIALLKGQMSYPSIAYLDEKFGLIQAVPGFQNAKEFHQIITFFGKDFYKKENFEKYKSSTYKTQFGNVKI